MGELKRMVENVKIESVSLTMADHGCLTFWLTVKGYGWGVGIGGYCIGHGYLGADDDEFVVERGDGLEAMMRIMNVVGVEKWEDLKGKYCRVEKGSWGDSIHKIGNLIENRWFDLKEFFAEKQKEAE